ncbi:hypothetical protein [Candidatus Electronema sp. PJ]|uniref:hypothetical protein n=1 Tax=Candidatus Electronema sp. PJ TaxID=3401572 RepID=UPI003AA8A611
MAPSIDEFEDLTQFADESFDTEEVDLFEFSDDEDSPLLRLKSIVLSLDWDITEEILNELNEELANLRTMWKDDKVAQIYLQGMENVGKYMREEGAYAHPNAIKLLLTLYHNYEKIISSSNISGDSITTMLKADIRKFKVLQYQINALKKVQGGHAELAAEETAKPAAPQPEIKKKGTASPPAKKKESAAPSPLRSMEATILGLEWEVTDEGLEKFNTESVELRKHLSGNTEAQVLIQGLQALGAYIREQKSNAHPDAFTILHSFYDALKMLIESPELGAEQRRQILVEQISSLNSLKEVIARSAAGKAEEEADEPEEETLEDEEELSPGDMAPDFGEDEDEQTTSTSIPADDEEGIDFAFSFDDEEEAADDKPKSKVPSAAAPQPVVKPKAAAVAPTAASVKPVKDSADDEDEFDDDLFSDGAGSGVTPALADEDEEGGFNDDFVSADISGERAAELDEKLDSFFNFGDGNEDQAKPKKAVASVPPPVPPAEPKKQSLAEVLEDVPSEEEEEEEDDLDSSFFNFDDEEGAGATAAPDDGEDESLGFDDELFGGAKKTSAKPLPAVALADEEETDQSLSAVSAGDEDDEDDELDAFFNFDDNLDTGKAAVEKDEEDAPLSFGGSQEEEAEEEEPLIEAALADEDEAKISEDAVDDEDDALSSGLDSFFNFDEETHDEEASKKTQPKPATVSDTNINTEEEEDSLGLDSGLFSGLDEEETEVPPVTAALTDENFVNTEEEEDSLGLDSGLFSGLDEEETDEQPVAAALTDENLVNTEEEEDSLGLDSGLFSGLDEEETEVPPVAAALTDAEEESVVIDPGIDIERATEIKDKLDSFFNFDDELAAGEAVEAAKVPEDTPELDDELITALEDDEAPGSSKEDEDFFRFNTDEDTEPVAALADEDSEPEVGGLTSFLSTETADSQDELFGGLKADEEEDEAPGSSKEDDDFFRFDTDEEEETTEPVAALADEDSEPEVGGLTSFLSTETADSQDELFGGLHTDEEEDSFAADSKADEQEDTFFAFDGEISDQTEEQQEDFGSEEAEEAAEGLFGLNMVEEHEPAALSDEEADNDLLLGKEYEADSESMALFGQDELPDPFADSIETDEPAAEVETADFEEPESEPVSVSEIFSSLAAIAAALPTVPSEHHLRQVSELAAAARKEPSVPPHQSIMLNLLDTSAAMLAKAPPGAAGNAAIVQELAAGLDKAEEPRVLADMISRYTSWQQDFFTQIISSGQQGEDNGSEERVPLSIQKGFSQLKQELMEEFRQLRKELLEGK